MKKAYGDRTSRLKLRYSVLVVAASLDEVPTTPPDRRHELDGDWKGHFAVHVTGNWRLVFRPNHEPVPTREDGSINLAAVTAIELVDVTDYH